MPLGYIFKCRAAKSAMYKHEFTKRYENARNLSLLRSQLSEIKVRAVEVCSYYESNLTGASNIVKEFLAKKEALALSRDFHKELN
jgi:hypothetical protein